VFVLRDCSRVVFVMKRERVDERIERTAGDFFHNKGCSDYFFSFRSDVYFYSERVSLFLSLSFSLSLSLSLKNIGWLIMIILIFVLVVWTAVIQRVD